MKIYPVFIPHAGCPHRCLFCAQDRSTGQRSVALPDDVESWLDRTLPGHGDGEIAFYGGTFTLLPLARQTRYLTMAAGFVAAGRVAGTRLSTRPDALQDSILVRLMEAGVTTVEIGCQSFSQAVLDASGRGHTAVECVAAIKRCRLAGLKVGVQLMPGLPGSDAAEAMLSLRQALALKPAFLRIYPTVVIAGTALAELWRKGRFFPWTLEEAVEICADMLQLCQAAEVPVIRLGLQAEAQLEKHVLAGPYHPAFGQLVRSRLWRRALLQAGAFGRPVRINPVDLSDALGHRAENRQWFLERGTPVCLETDRAIHRGRLSISGLDLQLEAVSSTGGRHA